jgi:hypothetical protein
MNSQAQALAMDIPSGGDFSFAPLLLILLLAVVALVVVVFLVRYLRKGR